MRSECLLKIIVAKESTCSLTLEILVAIALTVGRSVAQNIGAGLWFVSSDPRPYGFSRYLECVNGLYLAGFVLLVVFVKRESWREIGIVSVQWGRDLMTAVWLIIVSASLWALCSFPLYFLNVFKIHDPISSMERPSALADYVWLVLSGAFVGLGEELFMRGYLVSRLHKICGSLGTILMSASIFSLWHLYQGVEGMTRTFIWGLVFGRAFCRTQRIWPLVFAHAMNNVAGNLVTLKF